MKLSIILVENAPLDLTFLFVFLTLGGLNDHWSVIFQSSY